MILPDELRHLDEGPRAGERSGAGLAEVVATASDPAAVLQRCRDVLRVVLVESTDGWPVDDDWAKWLPEWFVRSCAPERSPDEAAEYLAWWRGLDAEGRARVAREESWSLASWLFWLQPHERTWFWWDGAVRGPDRAVVTVEVSGWPAPLGSLDWLLRAAGAESVVPADDLS